MNAVELSPLGIPGVTSFTMGDGNPPQWSLVVKAGSGESVGITLQPVCPNGRWDGTWCAVGALTIGLSRPASLLDIGRGIHDLQSSSDYAPFAPAWIISEAQNG